MAMILLFYGEARIKNRFQNVKGIDFTIFLYILTLVLLIAYSLFIWFIYAYPVLIPYFLTTLSFLLMMTMCTDILAVHSLPSIKIDGEGKANITESLKK